MIGCELMSLTSSLFILTWLAILVLALAISGLIGRLRALEGTLGVSYSRIGPKDGYVLSSRSLELVNIKAGRKLAVMLLATGTCITCDEVVPDFHEYARSHPEIDWRIVLSADVPRFHVRDGAAVTVAPTLISELSMPLFPAIAKVDLTGEVTTRSVGSIAGLHNAVEELVEFVTAPVEVHDGFEQR